jgi:branched-subunit amino acid ABC-type transport system permease component
MLTVILQQGINGIVVGSLYVLVALGLTLIYGVLVQINFAHADIVTIGAFVAYFVASGPRSVLRQDERVRQAYLGRGAAANSPIGVAP